MLNSVAGGGIHRCSDPTETYEMSQSMMIGVDASVLGAVLRQENRVRFIVADTRVAGMDRTIGPEVADALCAAQRMSRAGRVLKFDPSPIED